MLRTLTPILVTPILMTAAVVLSGCVPGEVSDFELAETVERRDAFNVSREVLLDVGFILDRVDAGAGVITTKPKETVGLMTPRDREQRTLGQEWQDTVNHQSRVVAVSIVPGEPDRVVIEATLYRRNRPGRRIETESIGTSTRSQMTGDEDALFDVPIRRDAALEAYLARLIAERLGIEIARSGVTDP
ncbi:MAG: hypothetical protein AAGI17_09290 [Planctomycetota bacterium]